MFYLWPCFLCLILVELLQIGFDALFFLDLVVLHFGLEADGDEAAVLVPGEALDDLEEALGQEPPDGVHEVLELVLVVALDDDGHRLRHLHVELVVFGLELQVLEDLETP